jgi:hypothetical protein
MSQRLQPAAISVQRIYVDLEDRRHIVGPSETSTAQYAGYSPRTTQHPGITISPTAGIPAHQSDVHLTLNPGDLATRRHGL